MHKIKLLIVTDEMEVGGTQRQITYMLKHIDKQRFAVTLVYFRNSSFMVDQLIEAGVEVKEIKKNKRLDILFLYNFYTFMKERDFDIVHCFSFTGELWGTTAAILTQKKTIISSIRNVYDWYSPLQWRIKKWVSSHSKYIVSNSRAGADYALSRTGLPDDNMKVVYNGIPEIQFKTKQKAREALGFPLDQRIGLFIGRLVEQKNVSSLIDALNIITTKDRNFKFYIVGAGPEQIDLKNKISSQAENTVVFLGEMSNITNILSASDFVVQPSVREGLSNTILEAMLAAKPVIASHVGGSPELIDDGKTGFLYPSGDVTKLSEHIDYLIDAEASVLNDLGAGAQAKALGTFTIDALVQNMELLYQSCVD